MQTEGNVDGLIGITQRRTGTARREIEEFFDHAFDTVANSTSPFAATAQEYVQHASEALSQGYEHIADHVQKGYTQAEDLVRMRPAEFLLVAFGAGIITGVLTTLLIRSSR